MILPYSLKIFILTKSPFLLSRANKNKFFNLQQSLENKGFIVSNPITFYINNNYDKNMRRIIYKRFLESDSLYIASDIKNYRKNSFIRMASDLDFLILHGLDLQSD